MALGVTQQLPLDDRYTYPRDYLVTRLAMMFGGRAAEELMFGQMTTGAGDDIEKATELSRKMVCEWGMSKELGPMTFGRREEQVFLGRDIGHQKDYSEQTALEIDREVRRIIDEAYQKARQPLSDHLVLPMRSRSGCSRRKCSTAARSKRWSRRFARASAAAVAGRSAQRFPPRPGRNRQGKARRRRKPGAGIAAQTGPRIIVPRA